MDIVKSVILMISALFSIVAPPDPDYIKLGIGSLEYSFKTGDNYPITYYLSVTNIGPLKANFIIDTNVQWITAFREAEPIKKSDRSAVLDPYYHPYPINFILEIDPSRLPDGSSLAEVTLTATHLSNYTILDTDKVSVLVQKNVVTPTAIVTVSPALTPRSSPVATAQIIPTITTVPTILTSPTTLPTTVIKPSITKRPTVSPTPLKLFKPIISPKIKLSATPSPKSSFPSVKKINETEITIVKRFFLFFRSLFI